MKLKDYKKYPETYNQILNWCKASGIAANDESDAIELLEKIQKADIAHAAEIIKKAINNYRD